jgi:hypothetical protein
MTLDPMALSHFDGLGSSVDIQIFHFHNDSPVFIMDALKYAAGCRLLTYVFLRPWANLCEFYVICVCFGCVYLGRVCLRHVCPRWLTAALTPHTIFSSSGNPQLVPLTQLTHKHQQLPPKRFKIRHCPNTLEFLDEHEFQTSILIIALSLNPHHY